MSDDTISYEGIDEATLIHALHHGTQPLGMGWLHNQPALTVEQTKAALDDRPASWRYNIDYFFGRPLKVNLDTEAKTFRSRLYDRDAGDGAAQRVVDSLRTQKAVG